MQTKFRSLLSYLFSLRDGELFTEVTIFYNWKWLVQRLQYQHKSS